jgi:hypothetical protein
MVSKLLNKKQYKVHQTINTPPELKVDIILNMQTNACEYQRQVFKLKYKGKRKEST